MIGLKLKTMKNKLLKILSRILIVILCPIGLVYALFCLAVIQAPYWIITGESFMDDYGNYLPDLFYDYLDSMGDEE